MAVKEFLKPTSKNKEIGRFNLESFLTNLENQLQCTAEFVSKTLKDLFFYFQCVHNSWKYALYSY